MASKNNVLQIIINGSNRTGKAFKSVARGASVMAAAVTAAFTAAAFSAGKFEKGLVEISTLLDGDTGPSIDRMREQIQSLSVEFGQTMESLTKAQYDIVSAGFTDAADAAEVLRVSTKLAIAGVSDVSSTADLLTTAINGLGGSAGDTEAIADVLFQTVRKGKTTMDQLAASFGPVFASARVAGIGIEELGGVMATLTAAGINTAETATALNNLLRQLAAPTGEAGKALAEMGINLDEGLTPALIKLGKVSEGGLDALAKVVPNIRALKAAAVAASDVEKLTANIDAMGESTGVVNDGVEKMQETFDQSFKRMKASQHLLVVELGTKLLPTFERLFDGLRLVAAMAIFLTGKTDDGAARWKEYGQAMLDAVPGANALVGAITGVADALEKSNIAARKAGEMKKIRAGLYEQDPGKYTTVRRFAPDVIDSKKLTADAAKIYDRLVAEGKIVVKTIAEDGIAAAADVGTAFADIFAKIKSDMDAAAASAAGLLAMQDAVKNGMIPSRDAAVPGKIGPDAPAAAPLGDSLSGAGDEVNTLRADLESLAVFMADDFASVAFGIGDAFAGVFTDITAGMLGLRDGPIMVGEAFSQMAEGIIADLARIIARMAVAKALLSVFGGGGFVASMAGGLQNFATGGVIPHGSSGMAVAGGGFPLSGFVMPGAAGLDRTLVMAHGGEVMIPRQSVDAINRAQKRPSGPGQMPQRRQRSGGTVNVINQVSRPFNVVEQALLADSVNEGLARAGRYRG